MVPPVIDITGTKWDNPNNSSVGATVNSTPRLPQIVHAYKYNLLSQVWVVKEPLAWIISYGNYNGAGKTPLSTLAERWNIATRSYLDAYKRWNGPKAMVEYFSLLANPEDRATRLARQLQVDVRSEVIIRGKIMGRGGDLTIPSDATVQRRFNKKAYYLNAQYLTCFTDNEKNNLFHTINWSLYDQVKAIDAYDPQEAE